MDFLGEQLSTNVQQTDAPPIVTYTEVTLSRNMNNQGVLPLLGDTAISPGLVEKFHKQIRSTALHNSTVPHLQAPTSMCKSWEARWDMGLAQQVRDLVGCSKKFA